MLRECRRLTQLPALPKSARSVLADGWPGKEFESRRLGSWDPGEQTSLSGLDSPSPVCMYLASCWPCRFEKHRWQAPRADSFRTIAEGETLVKIL